jgi:hypothetical protein
MANAETTTIVSVVVFTAGITITLRRGIPRSVFATANY